jgi:hypothetical protein
MLKLQEGGNNKGYIGAGGGGLYIKNLAGDVIFRNSSDADTIRIKDSGNVGINTTSPSQKLHVVGATKFETPSTSGGFKNYFSNSGAGGQDYWIMSTSNSNGSLLGGKFAIGTDAVSGNNAAQTRFLINASGNVGIDTTDPKRPLQIGATGSFPISFNGNYPDIHMNTYYESGWRIHTAGFGAKTTFNGATGAFGFSNVASTQVAGATFTPQERLTILANGNIGIGTTSPSYPLHISGTGHQRLKIEKTDAGGDADVQISSRNDGAGWVLFHDNDSGNNSGVIKYVHSTNKMHFRTNDIDDRLVISSDGNVGIGINNPQQLLHVQAGSTGNGTIRVGGGAGLEISHDNAGVTLQRIDSLYRTTNADANLQIRTGILTLHTGSGNTERMRIDADGDVSIDHDVAYSKLFVNGGGGTKKSLTTLATSNTGGAHPDLDTAAVVLGSPAGRNFVSGNYIAGIAFDHLLNHQSALPFNYGQNPHGWIGLKMWDSPGYERSSLVFCTREDTTSASAKTIERMQITPWGNVGINRTSPPAKFTVNGNARIEIDSAPSGLFSENSDMHRDGALIFPVTASQITQANAAGAGFFSMGWATTSRSGEQMHRNVSNRYMNGGSGTAMGFYIEAGTGEAGGICLDEDSTQVYGSSDNGTTFRIIDKDSDIVIMEMLQSSWNMSVRGAVSSSQSSFSGLSDRRVKKGFQDVSTENILTKYNNLDLKSYIRIDSYDYMKDNYENEEDLREIGLVAQEVEEIFPDVVGTTPVVDPRGMDSVWEELGEELTEIKNINQTGLLYKTIEAVQALIEENTALKARLDALEE